MSTITCMAFKGRRPLVLIGDSHLARLDIGHVARLESALHGLAVVHNHAIGGANSADLVERAPHEAAIRGALFVISVGTNDLAPWKRVPPSAFAANAGRLLEVLGGGRCVVLLPPTVDEASQARSHGDQGRTNALVAEYGGVLTRVSREGGAVVVDLAALLVDKRDVREPDGVHLNPHGSALLVGAISEGVGPLLAD